MTAAEYLNARLSEILALRLRIRELERQIAEVRAEHDERSADLNAFILDRGIGPGVEV